MSARRLDREPKGRNETGPWFRRMSWQIFLDLVAPSIYSRRRFRHTSMLQSGAMKSVCFLLGAVIVALILPAQAPVRGRSLCASSRPALPASAAGVVEQAE